MRLFKTILLFALLIRVNADNTVTLAWDPNSETNLTGYKIYWGTATRTYINKPVPTVGVSATPTYTTPALANGTWYFAVTAYNSTGESGYSNEVSTAIPKPTTKPTPPGGFRRVIPPK